MTTIKRRTPKLSRYIVLRTWDQEHARHMWSVIDRDQATWARTTSATGYPTEDEAQARCQELRAKEKS